MMTEQWSQWKPINNLAGKYYIESISDNINGLKIVFFEWHNETKKVIITFTDSVDAYRSTDEIFRLKLISDLKEKYKSKLYGKWTFFKVDNSAYIKWLSKQSYTISDERSFMHFSFVGVDSILDVVTNYEPKVALINETKD